MQDIGQTPSGSGSSSGLPPMPPKDGEMARPAKPAETPKEQNWDLIKSPPKPKEAAPGTAPGLAYKGNLLEFKHDIKGELRQDLGKKLSVSQRAEVTKILSKRGGKFMGTRKERNELRQFAKDQGMPKWKERQLLREAKNLKGKTRAT